MYYHGSLFFWKWNLAILHILHILHSITTHHVPYLYPTTSLYSLWITRISARIILRTLNVSFWQAWIFFGVLLVLSWGYSGGDCEISAPPLWNFIQKRRGRHLSRPRRTFWILQAVRRCRQWASPFHSTRSEKVHSIFCCNKMTHSIPVRMKWTNPSGWSGPFHSGQN